MGPWAHYIILYYINIILLSQARVTGTMRLQLPLIPNKKSHWAIGMSRCFSAGNWMGPSLGPSRAKVHISCTSISPLRNNENSVYACVLCVFWSSPPMLLKWRCASSDIEKVMISIRFVAFYNICFWAIAPQKRPTWSPHVSNVWSCPLIPIITCFVVLSNCACEIDGGTGYPFGAVSSSLGKKQTPKIQLFSKAKV